MRIRVLSPLLMAALVVAAIYLLRRDEPERPDTAAVVAQVQRLNELATVKYTVQKVVGLEERAQPVGVERILLILQASVTAGVDLQTLTAKDVEIDGEGGVLIRMPPAKILNVAVDENQTRVWDRQKTWWTPWVPYSKDLEQRARVEGVNAIRQAALDMGILNQAKRNAESSVRGLLELAGIKHVTIIPANAS